VHVWRISNYADLSGRGGLIAAGRWNHIGTPIVYCSDHPATTLLEMLVRIDRTDVPGTFKLLRIDVPEASPTALIEEGDLPAGWRLRPDLTQSIGTDRLDQLAELAIVVPCAIVPFARNVLLNPRHPDIDRCKVIDVIDAAFDPRLIR